MTGWPPICWFALRNGSFSGRVLAVLPTKPSIIALPPVRPLASVLMRVTNGPLLLVQPSQPECAMSTYA